MRVADDLGKHKMAFKILNKPVFGMKGSYVVTKVNRVEWIFQTISTQAFLSIFLKRIENSESTILLLTV